MSGLCARMGRLVRIGIVLGPLLPATPAYSQATAGDAWRSDVASFAERLVEAGLTPGMGIAVSREDSVVYAAGFGLADRDTGREVDAETAFYIGSTTKALTATAVLLLAERGVLDLGAPVTRYLPELRFQPPLDADSVRIRDLLTMTHGIADGGPVVHRTAYTGEFTNRTLVELLAGYGPADTGRAFNYGNLGYNILGLVLDAVDPAGWKEVVQREVVAPLGMTRTSAWLSRLAPETVAMPHQLALGEGFRRIRLGKADATMHAAGGHFATPRDMARFVAAHASGGMLYGERIFPRDLVEASHENHAAQDRDFGSFHRFGWGYGWDLGTYEGKTVVHRFGSFTGYRSQASFMPEHGIGVVVLVNSGGIASPAADLLTTYVYDRLLERPDLEAVYAARLAELETQLGGNLERMTAQTAERRARDLPLSHPLEAYAGSYESANLGRMEWRVADGGLDVRAGVAGSRATVYDAAEDELRIEITGGGEFVDFAFEPGADAAGSFEYQGETFVRAPTDERCGRVQALVDSLRASVQMPGMSAAIATQGGVVCSVATGLADRESGRAATPRTRFRIGSVSKILTAHAVARLAGDGRLDLDAPIQTYVPAFPPKSGVITARTLATHTAGIRHYTPLETIQSSEVSYATAAEGLARFAADALLFEPGARYHYSSYGYNLLGAAVEGATGKAFPAAIRELVLDPLGLAATATDTLSTDPERATDYEWTRAGIVRATPDDLSYKWPSGGYVSTAEDLARLGIAHLDDARVSPAMRALLFTPQRLASGEEVLVSEGRGIGLGWRIEQDDAGRRFLHHGGATRGGRAMVLLYPDEGVAVALAGNLLATAVATIDDAGLLAAPFLAAVQGAVSP